MFDMCCGLAAICLNYVKKIKYICDPLFVIGIKRSIFPSGISYKINIRCVSMIIPAIHILSMYSLFFRLAMPKNLHECQAAEQLNKAYAIIILHLYTIFTARFLCYHFKMYTYNASQSKNTTEIYRVNMKYWMWRVASDGGKLCRCLHTSNNREEKPKDEKKTKINIYAYSFR